MRIIRNTISEVTYKRIVEKLDCSSFIIKNNLNPKLWEGEKLKSDVREVLIKIASDYYNNLELPMELLDITLTGSLANYNWSNFSDIDLHIIYDIKQIDGDSKLIGDLLDTKTKVWNDKHNILIKGFDVELYLQPIDQEHTSSGVYSIKNDKWLIKPEIPSDFNIDKELVIKKYTTIINELNSIIKRLRKEGDYDYQSKELNRLKEKVRKMRKSGLERSGEGSPENITFKLLRRNGVIDKLNKLLVKVYDKSVTMEGVSYVIDEARIYETYPQEFDITSFKDIKTWKGKMEYAEKHLGKPIGRGSSRVVYKVDDTKVLKLAKNNKGVAQNEVEINWGNDSYYGSLLANVIEYDEDEHLWVEMELAKPIKKSDFKRFFGFDLNTVNMYLLNQRNLDNGKRFFLYSIDDEIEERLDEDPFIQLLLAFMRDSDSLPGDLAKANSWGLVKRDGSDDIVLIDFGITSDIYNDYYA